MGLIFLQLTELMKTALVVGHDGSWCEHQEKQYLFIWLFVCLFSAEFSTVSAFLFFTFYVTAFYSWQCKGACPCHIVQHLLQFA